MLKGFCTPTESQHSKCVTHTDEGFGDDGQPLGCSCQDDCVYADPTKDERPCCRNKCSICPHNSGWGAALDSPVSCDCQWDPLNRVSYNKARDDSALCSAWMCAPGEYVFEGNCVKCGVGSYQSSSTNSPSCLPCEVCPASQYREGCQIGNKGVCMSCTNCRDIGLTQTEECAISKDTVCVNATECAGTAEMLNCGDGMYHAGCDKTVDEDGWCEPCPIQDATDCPEGFFLNFLCTNTSTISAVPNECIPCNRFTCEVSGKFPARTDCGNPQIPTTMMEDGIKCSNFCTEPSGDVWVQRMCQFYAEKEDTYIR